MQSKKLNFFIHIGFIFMVFAVFFPILGMIMISVSNASDIQQYGYSIIPMHFSLDAYKLIFSDITPVLKAVFVTLMSATVAPALTVVLCSLMAYAISRPDFAYKKIANTYILIPMLFSGGLVPTYIVNTQLLGLGDSLWIYVFNGLVSTWNIILFRTFFLGIPDSLIESARIDGATEFKTFISIIIPMSKPIVASVFFIGALQKWNDFNIPLYYITNKDYFNIQYFLQNILREAEFINQTYKDNPAFAGEILPVETMPFAMAVVACIPILIVFPYMQKFFSKGMAVGAVKG